MIKILPIPAFKDNYIWAWVNEESNSAIIVDPGDAVPVLNFLQKNNITLSTIFITHKHADHSGGIAKLLSVYPSIPVYAHAIEKISHVTHFVEHHEIFTVENWVEPFRVIHIPGHTLGHVAFYSDGILFSGDTLFASGCGRIFEGTAEQMYASLSSLAALPDETKMYCGHEYTLANLRFAECVEPDNVDVQQRITAVEDMYSKNIPSLPSTIGLEKRTNPFLRCTEKSVRASVENHVNRKLSNTVEVFHALREWKNAF